MKLSEGWKRIFIVLSAAYWFVAGGFIIVALTADPGIKTEGVTYLATTDGKAVQVPYVLPDPDSPWWDYAGAQQGEAVGDKWSSDAPLAEPVPSDPYNEFKDAPGTASGFTVIKPAPQFDPSKPYSVIGESPTAGRSMIEVAGADGAIVEFPAGTPGKTIGRVMRKHYCEAASSWANDWLKRRSRAAKVRANACDPQVLERARAGVEFRKVTSNAWGILVGFGVFYAIVASVVTALLWVVAGFRKPKVADL